MPTIFSPPRVVVVSADGLPAAHAKAYFYRTATSTPQAVYADSALQTAHSQPVEADANGVFPAIYLDSNLPNYRVLFTTAADVTIYQQDDVYSGATGAQHLIISGTAAELVLIENGASADNGKWMLKATGERLTINLMNDAESVLVEAISIDRAGMSADVINIGNTTAWQINLGGVLSTYNNTAFLNGELLATVKGLQTGTGTLTGCTTAPTATLRFNQIGRLVFCYLPALQATSNATTCTITGAIPTDLRPLRSQAAPIFVLDSGTAAIGQAQVDASTSTIQLFKGNQGAFTNSGGKGVSSAQSFIWTLD